MNEFWLGLQWSLFYSLIAAMMLKVLGTNLFICSLFGHIHSLVPIEKNSPIHDEECLRCHCLTGKDQWFLVAPGTYERIENTGLS